MATELNATNDRVALLLDQLKGTSYAQEVTINALMLSVLRDNDLNRQRSQIVFNSLVESRRAQMTPDALPNFDTTVNNARLMFEASTA